MPKQRKIKHYRYGYANRRQGRSQFWKGVFFVLLLAVLVFIGYCIAKAVGNLLEQREESSSQPESSLPESSLVISSEPESTSISLEPVRPSIRAIVIPQESMVSLDTAAAFLDTVDVQLYNSVVAELKDSSGTLYYTSQVELAQTCWAVSSGALDAAALAQLIEDKGFTPIARIYTLQDDVASHASYDTSYLYRDQTDVTWLDNAPDSGGKSWLNPYMANTADYLADLCGELADSGFETILACGLQYPDTRYTADMGYGPALSTMTAIEALQNVLDQMETEAARYGGAVIPVLRGEGYLTPDNHLYSDSANVLKADLTSPLLPQGGEAEILAAVTAPKEDLVPTLQSSEQLPLLETSGIEQYVVG